MAIKIFISGNALRATDTQQGGVELMDTPKGDVYYFNQSLNNGIIKIGKLPLNDRVSIFLEVDLVDAVDKDLVAFTADTFRTFCNDNLGFDLAPSDRGIQSSVNSSTTPLTSAATFTGTAELNSYSDVMVYVATDQNGTYYVEFSSDGINWDTSLSFIYDTNNINAPHTFVKAERYFRVRFTNTSASSQTYLRLSTYYGSFNQLSIPLNGTISGNYDSTPTRPTNYRYEVAMGRRQGRTTWNKFGYNDNISASANIIASFGGTFNIMTSADTLNVVSTANNDSSGGQAARTIVLVGIDSNGDYQDETVTMNGQTPVTTTNTWVGINRAYVASVGNSNYNQGDITISDTSAIYGTQAQIPSMIGVTQQCIFFVESGHKFLSDWITVTASKTGVTPFVQINGYVFSRSTNIRKQIFTQRLGGGSASDVQLTPSQPFVIDENDVLYFEATSDKTNTKLSMRFSGILEQLI
tara:strand:- start:9949 stop:11349 length:1401 start_codon:yes stop_codon:yes gene_type:complete